MFKNYFKVARRFLLNHLSFTTINIFGLAIGISVCLIIYLIASFELSYDSFHPGKDRIYRVVSEFEIAGKKYPSGAIPDPAPMVLRKEFSGLETVAAFHNYYTTVTIPDGTGNPHKFAMPKKGEEPSEVVIAEPEYFKLFEYNWLAGTAATALEEPYKVVLSESEAHKYFGPGSAYDMIGKEVIYNDSLKVTVSGIVEDWHKNSDFIFKDFISFSTVPNSFLKEEVSLDEWGTFNSKSQAFIKLAQGVVPAQIESQIPGFIKKYISLKGDSKLNVSLQPLSDIHFNAAYKDTYSRKVSLTTLYILMGIAAFILLIAVVNFINLNTAQSIQRTKEIGIRKVLGSSKGSLIAQFLVETFIVTSVAVLISLLIAWPVLSGTPSLIPGGVAGSLFYPTTFIFLLLVIMVTTLVAGFYPAMVLSSYLPLITLKGGSVGKGGQKAYLRRMLIVFQFVISLILIIGMLVVNRQTHYLLNKDLGFTKEGIINLEISRDPNDDKKSLLAAKIRQLADVEFVSINMGTPAAENHSGTLIKYDGASDVKAQFEIGDENYIPLFQLRLLAGRNISQSDTIKELLINETCARSLGFKEPKDVVGKVLQIGIGNKKRPVVGLIADFNSQSLHERIQPTFITSSKSMSSSISVKLHNGTNSINHFKNTIAAISDIWKGIYPDKKFNYSFFDETIAQFYLKEKKTAAIMNIAMVIAILISCMGLFGLSTYIVRQRTKEIGIRKTLGASVGNIATMLNKDFILLIIIAALIASPVAWYFMSKWLQEFAYRVQISWWIFLMAGVLAILITLLTVSFQAIRAAVANPVKSLKTEG